jgi:hypothetical protein
MSLKGPIERFSFAQLGRSIYAAILDVLPQSAPVEPSEQVKRLIQDVGLSQSDITMIHRVYQRLRLVDGHRRDGNHLTLASSAVISVVRTHSNHVQPLLRNILQLGGCYERVDWDQFLYVSIKLCTLTKVEICQLLFLVIVRELRGLDVHYLTSTQLDRFYESYRSDGVPSSMNCSKIHFSNFPLARYYVTDFIEVCFLYAPLVNPILILQRQFQAIIPSVSFWEKYDFLPGINRKISLDFFLIKRANVSMTNASSFQETCDLLLLSSDFVETKSRSTAKAFDGGVSAGAVQRWMELDFLTGNRKSNLSDESLIKEVYNKMPNEGLVRKEADIGMPV